MHFPLSSLLGLVALSTAMPFNATTTTINELDRRSNFNKGGWISVAANPGCTNSKNIGRKGEITAIGACIPWTPTGGDWVGINWGTDFAAFDTMDIFTEPGCKGAPAGTFTRKKKDPGHCSFWGDHPELHQKGDLKAPYSVVAVKARKNR